MAQTLELSLKTSWSGGEFLPTFDNIQEVFEWCWYLKWNRNVTLCSFLYSFLLAKVECLPFISSKLRILTTFEHALNITNVKSGEEFPTRTRFLRDLRITLLCVIESIFLSHSVMAYDVISSQLEITCWLGFVMCSWESSILLQFWFLLDCVTWNTNACRQACCRNWEGGVRYIKFQENPLQG